MRGLIYLMSVIVMACISTPSAIAQATCRSPDQYSTYLVNNITSLMLNANPNDGASRTALHLPLVPTNKITLVTDSRVCSKALAAYNTALGPRGTGSTASTKLTVVKVGNDRYVVFDPDQTAGEYIYQMTLDSKYKVLMITGT